MSPRTMGLAVLAGAVALAAGVAGVALASSANAASTNSLVGAKYVALGDSYSAGLGLPPYSATPSPGCLQSTNGIAEQVAAKYQLALTDVSCSGATIANVLSTAQTVTGGGSVPAQLDAVTPDTALVSLVIGGNDAGFSTVLPTCAAASANGPLLLDPTAASCAAKYGSQLTAAIQGAVAPALDALLAAIHQKAPNATVVLLGYPSLSPTDAHAPAAGCFSSALGTGQPPFPQNAFPFTTTDRSYIADLSAQLDAAQQTAATKNGAIFVSNLASTDAHTPCAGTADLWVNGISLTALAPPSVELGSLHPNATGAAFLAEQLAVEFEKTAAEPTVPSTVTPEAPPANTGTDVHAAATGPTASLAATGSDGVPQLVGAVVVAGVGIVLLIGRRRLRSS